MGAVGGLLGLGGGAAGTGFASPAQAGIQTPTTSAQALDQYNNAQNALQQQNAFLQATQAQNGLTNQSNVFNQMQGVANGTGPNPAQAQLAQATGANVANQAALMAGQRGSNANVGLLARQAAQQGANTQQQAAGQAATLQAQQSLGALQQLGGIAGQQVAQQQGATQQNTQATQNEQQNILNAIGQQNASKVGSQSSFNQTNAGLAGQQMQGQQGLIGGAANALGSIFAEGGKIPYMASGGAYDTAFQPMSDDQWNQTAASPNTPNTIPAQNIPSNKSSNKQQSGAAPTTAPDFGNPGANALYKGISSFGHFLANKFSNSSTPKANAPNSPYAGSGFSDEQIGTEQARQAAQQAGGLPAEDSTDQTYGRSNPSEQMSGPDASDNSQMNAAKGGKVPAMVSPGEQYLPPKDVKKVAKDGKSPLSVGERIPGKPKFKGNNYANDIVPKTLESGGIVIPNSVMQAKDPHTEAIKFVHATIAKNRKK